MSKKQNKFIYDNHFSKKYELVEEIGKTDFSIIYKATFNKQPYCIKEINEVSQNGSKDQVNVFKYFKQEFDNCQRIKEKDCDQLVKIYDIITTQDKIYLVMEYCDYDLRNYFNDDNLFQYLKIDQKLDFCISIAKGLVVLHDQIQMTHRDIKPENILISKDQKGNLQLKIADFGISSMKKQMQTQIGTLCYVAPEVLRGDQYFKSVDVFSFGCLIYFIFTNSELIEPSDRTYKAIQNYKFVDFKHNISECINRLIINCTKIDQQERLSMIQVLDKLVEIKKNINNPNYNITQLDFSFIY